MSLNIFVSYIEVCMTAMAELRVYIDDRESWRRDLTEHPKYSEIVKSQRLDDADIQVWYGEQLVVMIERKTVDDLCGSIKDGRFVNQRSKLIHKYDKSRILYLIEGVIPFNSSADGKKYNHMDVSVLRGCILNSTVRDGIHCYCCKDYDDMLGFITNLIDRVRKDPAKYTQYVSSDCDTSPPEPHIIKTVRGQESNPQKWLVGMLCQLPGISQATATILAVHFKTVRAISDIACQGESSMLSHIRPLFQRKPSHKIITTLVIAFGA